MKRLLLAACALAGTYGITQANTVTVNNLTGCTYTLNFSSSIGTAPPGISVHTSAPGTDIIACKIIYDYAGPNNISIGVGMSPDYPPYANSSMFPYTPPCLTSSFYTVAWSQSGATANATLVIF